MSHLDQQFHRAQRRKAQRKLFSRDASTLSLGGLKDAIGRLFSSPASSASNEDEFYDQPAYLRERVQQLLERNRYDEAMRMRAYVERVQERFQVAAQSQEERAA